MTKRYFQVKVTHKLLHNSNAKDLHPPVELGTIRATVTYPGLKRVIRFSNPNFDIELMQRAGLSDSIVGTLQPIIRERIIDFIKDGNSKYPIVWSEDNCIETEIKELN